MTDILSLLQRIASELTGLREDVRSVDARLLEVERGLGRLEAEHVLLRDAVMTDRADPDHPVRTRDTIPPPPRMARDTDPAPNGDGNGHGQ